MQQVAALLEACTVFDINPATAYIGPTHKPAERPANGFSKSLQRKEVYANNSNVVCHRFTVDGKQSLVSRQDVER
jgi:hypothetical protein